MRCVVSQPHGFRANACHPHISHAKGIYAGRSHLSRLRADEQNHQAVTAHEPLHLAGLNWQGPARSGQRQTAHGAACRSPGLSEAVQRSSDWTGAASISPGPAGAVKSPGWSSQIPEPAGAVRTSPGGVRSPGPSHVGPCCAWFVL